MRLIRDILKEKRTASRDQGMEQADQSEMDEFVLDDAPGPQEDLTLEPELDERPDMSGSDADSEGDDEDKMFDDLKPLSPVRVAPRKVKTHHETAADGFERQDESEERDTETADSRDPGGFDGDAFMKRLNGDPSDTPLPDDDPFDKLSGQQSMGAAKQVSPSPLKSMRAQFRDQPRPARPVAVEQPRAEARSVEDLTPLADATDLSPVDIPGPTAGRGGNRSGRVKTRLLGFSAGALDIDDPFAKEESNSDGMFPVGWVVVISEMGRGASFPLFDGVAKVGRGTDQSVCLNFGDNSISRENHISIAFDSEQNKFFVGHSGKSNLVRLNGKPLLSTEELRSKDLIRLGETTLRFIAFCTEDFGWTMAEDEMIKHEQQEDTLAVDFSEGADLGFIVLADGMGGHAAGDVASKIVVTEMFAELKMYADKPEELESNIGPVMQAAVNYANACVGRVAYDNPQSRGMGSTIVAPILISNRLYWISVGDSPLYLFRGSRLFRLNEEHSVASQMNRMVALGEINPEEAEEHPDRQCLTSVLIGSQIPEIDCRDTPVALRDKDILIAASDGLQFISEQKIARIVFECRDQSSAEIGSALLNSIQALADPDQDNVSLCVLKLRERAAIETGHVKGADEAPAPYSEVSGGHAPLMARQGQGRSM